MKTLGKLILATVVLWTVFDSVHAQESSAFKGFFDNWEVSPVAAAQMWSTYTLGAELYDRDSMRYVDVDDRLNFSLRRTRLGAKIKAGEAVTLNLIAAIDNVGRDILAGQPGGANNGAFPQVQLWNVFVKWRLKQESEAFNLVIGYHSPHFSRESPTAWNTVASLDKSQSQAYIRRHLTGKNPGRSMGVTFGGIALEGKDNLQFHYSIGVFNSIFGNAIGNSAGIKSSPLVTGRAMISFGQPESQSYSIGHKFNALSKRNGLSLAVSGSYEGQNELFMKSYASAFDFLYNHKRFNLSGEIAWLFREGTRVTEAGDLRMFRTNAYVLSTSFSYNIELTRGHILEPSVTYMRFSGPSSLTEVLDALSVSTSGGINEYVDLGLSYHIIPGKLKIDLHYVAQSGEALESNLGDSINDFFFQSGFAIRRGDYIGAGVMFVL